MRKLPKSKGKIMLNLGCGGQKLKGYIGIDRRDVGQDVIWDLTQGIPFPDESVDEVYSSHFVEHLTDDESMDLFEEILRVLKKGGMTHHRCPHQSDPTAYFWGHKTFWNEARINATVRVPSLKRLLLLENHKKGFELFFAFKKI